MGKDLNGKELGKGIHQRKDGRYELRLFKNGITKSIYGTDIDKLRKKYRENNKRKESGAQQDETIDFIYEILKKEWKSSIGAACTKNYDYQYKIIKKYIADTPLIAITPSMIRKMLNEIENQYSRSVCVQVLYMLRKILKKAELIGIVPYDATKKIVIKNEYNPKIEILNQNEIEMFTQVCSGKQYEDLFLLLLYSGITVREACILKWDDVNFEEGSLKIDGAHARKIPLEQEVREILVRREKLSHKSTDRIFSSKSGKELTSKYVADELRKISCLLEKNYAWKRNVTSTVLRNTFIYKKYVKERTNLFLLAGILGISYETCEEKIILLTSEMEGE